MLQKPTLTAMLLVVGCVVGLGYAGSQQTAQSGSEKQAANVKSAGAESPDAFQGVKVLLVQTDEADSVFAIEGARFQVIGDRLFVVGTGFAIEGEVDWQAGIEMCIAWDSVRTVFRMKTLEDYERFLEVTSES